MFFFLFANWREDDENGFSRLLVVQVFKCKLGCCWSTSNCWSRTPPKLLTPSRLHVHVCEFIMSDVFKCHYTTGSFGQIMWLVTDVVPAVNLSELCFIGCYANSACHHGASEPSFFSPLCYSYICTVKMNGRGLFSHNILVGSCCLKALMPLLIFCTKECLTRYHCSIISKTKNVVLSDDFIELLYLKILLLLFIWKCKEMAKAGKGGSNMTTDEWTCGWACKNSCRFCFGNQHHHHTHTHTNTHKHTHTHALTARLGQVTQKERNTLVTHLPHPLLRKTKANHFVFAFTPRYTHTQNTQNTYGPLVFPLKH